MTPEESTEVQLEKTSLHLVHSDLQDLAAVLEEQSISLQSSLDSVRSTRRWVQRLALQLEETSSQEDC